MSHAYRRRFRFRPTLAWSERENTLITRAGFVLKPGPEEVPPIHPRDWVRFGSDWRVVSRVLRGEEDQTLGYWITTFTTYRNVPREIHPAIEVASVADWLLDWALDPPSELMKYMPWAVGRQKLHDRGLHFLQWATWFFRRLPDTQTLGRAVEEGLQARLENLGLREESQEVMRSVATGREVLRTYLARFGLTERDLKQDGIVAAPREHYRTLTDPPQFLRWIDGNPFIHNRMTELGSYSQLRFSGLPHGGYGRRTAQSIRSKYGIDYWRRISMIRTPEAAVDFIQEVMQPDNSGNASKLETVKQRRQLLERLSKQISGWPNELLARRKAKAVAFLIDMLLADGEDNLFGLTEVVATLVASEGRDLKGKFYDATPFDVVTILARKSMDESIQAFVADLARRDGEETEWKPLSLNEDLPEWLEDEASLEALSKLRSFDFNGLVQKVGTLAALSLTNALHEMSEDSLSCEKMDQGWVYWLSAIDPDFSGRMAEFLQDVEKFLSDYRIAVDDIATRRAKQWEVILSGVSFDLSSGLWTDGEPEIPDEPELPDYLDHNESLLVRICAVQPKQATLGQVIEMIDSHSPGFGSEMSYDGNGYGLALTYEDEDDSSFWTPVPEVQTYYELIRKIHDETEEWLQLEDIVG